MSHAHASDASDANLIASTRDGDEKAYAELWRRHSAAGLTVARSITSSLDHDDLVQEAFVRVFTAVRKGGGPKGAFRPYLFTTLRNTAAEWGRKRRETSLDTLESFEDPSTSEAATEAALDRGLTATAFRALPTRWQEVLWYSEVEQMTPAEIGPLLGMKANGVAALTYRAREGLRQSWIQAHINAAVEGSECRWTLERMGSYARSALGKRDTGRFDVHLDECAKCTIVVAEAKAVGSRIALVLLPLTIGATGASAYLAWLQSGQTAAVMAMPAGVAAGVGIGAPSTVGVGAAASGGSAGAGGGGGAGSGSAGGAAASTGSAVSGLSAGALAVGGTVIAGVLAAAVAAAVIFIPALLPGDGHNPTSPPQAAAQPPSVGDPDDDEEQSDDTSEEAPPADDVPDEEPPTDDLPEDDPPAEDPPANDEPPADDPPADDPPTDDSDQDESAPPAESDGDETITPDPPPVDAPTGLKVGSVSAEGPTVLGTATPGSEITVTAKLADSAATASVSSATEPTMASLTTFTSPFEVATADSTPPTFETKASDEDGGWSVTLTDLNSGTYTVTATARIGSVTSPASEPLTVEVPEPEDGDGDEGESPGDGEDEDEPNVPAITGVSGERVSDDKCENVTGWPLSACVMITSLTVKDVDQDSNVTVTVTYDHGEKALSAEGSVGDNGEVTVAGDELIVPWLWRDSPTLTVTLDGVQSAPVRLSTYVDWLDWRR